MNTTTTTPSTYDFGDAKGPVPAHKHPNGGGWVADTATVVDTAYVGPNARVYEEAQVFGSAAVFGKATVSGRATVSGAAWVFGEVGAKQKLSNGY